jgi:hypothetical protein
MKNLIFTFYILCAFNVFFLTPVSLLSDLYLHVFTLLGIISIFKNNYLRHNTYRYLIILLIVLIISSIGSSMLNLNQDLISAFIATQQLFKGFSFFFFLNWLKKDKINFQVFFGNLFRFSWLFAIYVAIVSLFKINFTFVSPLSGAELLITGAKYDKALIFFTIIYYFTLYFKNGKFRLLIAAIILFSTTQMYDIQRGDFVFIGFILIVLTFYYRKSIGVKKLFLFSPFYILVLIIGLSMLDLSNFSNKFEQLSLLFEGKDKNQIEDASVFIRIKETDFALSGFYDSPIFGNGLIRTSKQESLIGSIYFYPVDIGIFGILYTFGILGLIIYLSFLIYLKKIIKNKLKIISSVFLIYSIYIFAYSFKDGMLLFFPIQIIMCILFIYIVETKNNLIL